MHQTCTAESILLNSHLYKTLGALALGVQFTLDANYKDSGSNRLCHQYCPPSRPFQRQDAAGEAIWMHPPYSRLSQALRHHVYLKLPDNVKTGIPRHAPAYCFLNTLSWPDIILEMFTSLCRHSCATAATDK